MNQGSVYNASGMGPQPGGFFTTDSGYATAVRNDAYARQHNELALMRSEQFRRTVELAAPAMGGQKAANEFLYGTTPGQLALTGLGAIASRGPMGNPMALQFGLNQIIGSAGGAYRDYSHPAAGGVSRPFAGAGFVTDQVSSQLFKGVERALFGKDGQTNRVSGLTYDQVGEVMRSLAPTALKGRDYATIRSASKDEIIKQAIDMAPNPLIAEKLRGVTGANLDETYAKAMKDGDKQFAAQVDAIRKSSTIVEGDKQYEKDLTKIIKASSSVVATLSDVFGSDDMTEMAQQAKILSGKVIRTAADAQQVKSRVDEAIAFARSQGLDPKAYISSVGAGATAVNRLLEEKLGLSSASLSAAIGGMSTMHGVSVAPVEGYNAGEAQAMKSAGMVAQIQESPQITAAVKELTYGNLGSKDKAELSKLVDKFKTAGTPDARRQAQADVESFFNRVYGMGSYEAMGGQEGMNAALKDDTIARRVAEVTDAGTTAAALSGGMDKAFNMLNAKDRALLGKGGMATGEMLRASFSDPTRKKLLAAMKSGNTAEVRTLLEQNKRYLTNANGDAISVDEAYGMLSGGTDMANALAAQDTKFGMVDESKAVRSRQLDAETRSATLQERLRASVRSEEQRRGGKSFKDLIVEGFFSNGAGVLAAEGVVGVALEKQRAGEPIRGGVLGLKEGRLTAGADTLEKLFNGMDTTQLFEKFGVKNAAEFAKKLGEQKGDFSMQDDLLDFLSQNYQGARISDSEYGFVATDDYNNVEDEFALKGKSARLAQVLDTKDLDSTSAKTLATSALARITDSKSGLLEKAAKGDAEAMLKIQETEKLTGGDLGAAMQGRIDMLSEQLDQLGPDSTKWSKADYAKRDEVDRLKSVQAKLKESAAAGEGDIMRVVVTNWPQGGPQHTS